MKNPMKVWAYKNKKAYDNVRCDALWGYECLSADLAYMADCREYSVRANGVLDCISMPVPAYPDAVNKLRVKRVETAWNQMQRTMKCTDNRFCGNLVLCPDCLANWRYSIAKRIQAVGKKIPSYRLVYRREHYFYPRGVYFDPSTDRLEPMYEASFNPVYSLPDAHAPFVPTNKAMGGIDSCFKFKKDPEYLIEDYFDMFCYVWKHIGGPGLFAELTTARRKSMLEMSEERALKLKESITAKMKKQTYVNEITPDIRWFEDDPLMLTLECRRRALNKQTSYQPGSIQRVSIAPVANTNTMLRIRLDSLFIMTPERYNELKQESEECENDIWINQRRAKYLPMNGKLDCVWSYLKKVNCRLYKIPTDIIEILKIVERAFPFMGNRLARCSPLEMPLILGAVRDIKSIKTDGCFLDANSWA